MTGQELINAALRQIGVLRFGYTPNSTDSDACLVILNQILANWSAEGVMVYATQEDQLSLDGAAVYSWGSAGDLATPNPVRVKAARTIANDITMPAHVCTAEEFNAIKDRAATGNYVRKLFYDGYVGGPAGLHVWPLVDGPTLFIESLKALPSVSTLGSTITLAPGYELALKLALAVHIAPEFKVQLDASIPAQADAAKAALIAMNRDLLGGPTSAPPAAGGG